MFEADIEESIAYLVQCLVASIVDVPEGVCVTLATSAEHATYQACVGQSDFGTALGKSGRNANAVRTIAKAAPRKHKRKITVEVVAPSPHRRTRT